MQPKQNQSVISTENEEKCQKFCCKSAASNEKHYKSLFFMRTDNADVTRICYKCTRNLFFLCFSLMVYLTDTLQKM